MKIYKYLIISFCLICIILLPISNAETLPNSTDLYPNEVTIKIYNNGTYEYKIFTIPETTLASTSTSTNYFIERIIVKYNISKDAILNTFPKYMFSQTIKIINPNSESKNFTSSIENYVEKNNFYEFTTYFNKIEYYFQFTGTYQIVVDTRVINQSSQVNNYINNYYLYVITPSFTPPDLSDITFYDAKFIGTVSGFILGFCLILTPLFTTYKIKHTGEKLKWSVYGFLTICIVFFCMIAFFQMG